MNGVFRVFLSLSFSGSLLILLLLLARPLVQKRFSRRWQYYIWLVAIARLLLPLSPEVSLTGTLFQEAPAAEVLPLPNESAELQTLSPAAGTLLQSSPDESGPPGEILRQNIWAVWLSAAALLLIRKVTIYQSFGRYMRAGCTGVSDISLLERLGELCGQFGINRPVELYENPLASSPMLLGLCRPCVILPDAGLPEADFQYTLRHELTHYRRRDLLYKWLVQLTVCLHWFNPLVWLMEREISRACELACDEAVIRDLEPHQRRDYGDMLLRAMGTGGRYEDSAGSIPLNESGALLKERLGAIMKYKKSSKLVTIFSFLLAGILLMGAAAAGAYTGPAKARPDAAVPNAVKGDPSAAFRYTQEGYYQAPYLFEIGWNVPENAKKTYGSTALALPGGSTITVLYTSGCKDGLKDQDIRRALSVLLERLKAEQTDFPLTRPLVAGVRNMGNSSAADVAERSYKEADFSGFLAAFAMLEESAQRKWLDQFYGDDEIAYFSASADRIPRNSPLFAAFAEKAYADGDFSFFSVLVNRMSKSDLESWAARAIADNQLAFSSIIANASDMEWVRQETDKIKSDREKQQLEEYKAYGIAKNGADYYYQGQLTRIFVDFRANTSFVTLQTNPKGTAKVKVVRNGDGSIKSVEYLTESEISELFGDDWEDGGDAWDFDGQDTVVNVSKEELPEAVRKAMKDCAIKTWYLIHSGGKQYIYYNGFAWSFGYEPVLNNGKWTVDILRFQKKDSGYLLLSLPEGSPVGVTCDGEAVKLTEIQ